MRALGIQPPGSFVRLANGETGVVLRRGARANEPRVASLVNRDGAPMGVPAVRVGMVVARVVVPCLVVVFGHLGIRFGVSFADA